MVENEGKPGPVVTHDLAKMTMTLHFTDGTTKEAPLQKGPDGFVVAHFPDKATPFVTEMPNLILDAKPTKLAKKPAASIMKKPAAASASSKIASPEESDEEGGESEDSENFEKDPVADEEPEAIKKVYKVMYYKRDHTIAIRQWFLAKQQIASAGGKNCKATKETLEKWAGEAIAHLESGKWTEAYAKNWLRGKAGNA